jgi:hypothetical protein
MNNKQLGMMEIFYGKKIQATQTPYQQLELF